MRLIVQIVLLVLLVSMATSAWCITFSSVNSLSDWTYNSSGDTGATDLGSEYLIEAAGAEGASGLGEITKTYEGIQGAVATFDLESVEGTIEAGISLHIAQIRSHYLRALIFVYIRDGVPFVECQVRERDPETFQWLNTLFKAREDLGYLTDGPLQLGFFRLDQTIYFVIDGTVRHTWTANANQFLSESDADWVWTYLFVPEGSENAARVRLSDVKIAYNDGRDYVYYLPAYTSENGYWSGVGLSNENLSDVANVTIEGYNQSGQSLFTQAMDIEPGGQGSAVIGGGLNAKGWVKVSASSPIRGLSFLGLFPDFMADVDFADTLAAQHKIPHVAQNDGWDTSIYVANPNPVSCKVEIAFLDGEGELVGKTVQSIPAMGSIDYPLSNLGDAPTGSVMVQTSQGTVAWGLYSNLKTGGTSFSGISAKPFMPGSVISSPKQTMPGPLPALAVERPFVESTSLELASEVSASEAENMSITFDSSMNNSSYLFSDGPWSHQFTSMTNNDRTFNYSGTVLNPGQGGVQVYLNPAINGFRDTSGNLLMPYTFWFTLND